MQINNRLQFGKLFSKMQFKGNGAEIGVQRGDFSAVIRDTWNAGKIHLIDRWSFVEDYIDVARLSYREQLNNYLYVVNRFAEDFSINIYRMDSTEAALHFPDHFFDWIYIDADHTYEGCKRDLNTWHPKLKKGGILCGHDFLDGDIPAGIFGVKTAVEEFIKDKNVRLFITQEEEWKSWYFVNDPSFDVDSVKIEDKIIETHFRDNDSVEKLLADAENLIEKENYEDAKKALNKILGMDAENIDAYNDLSVIAVLENNLNGAEILINKILQIDPSNEVAIGNYNYLIEIKNKQK